MATRLMPYLIEIMEKHLPQLDHDINNATTLYTLQDAVRKLHQIVTYVVHHVVEEEYMKLVASRAPAATMVPAAPVPPPPRPAMAPQAIPQPASAISRMPLPFLGSTSSMPSMGPAPSVPAQQRVMDVNITPQGTQVKMPGGPVYELPPGAPVLIPEPAQPILNGPNDVVLPPGGGLGPEAEAALAAATGGARNVTNDPPVG